MKHYVTAVFLVFVSDWFANLTFNVIFARKMEAEYDFKTDEAADFRSGDSISCGRRDGTKAIWQDDTVQRTISRLYLFLLA